MAHSCGIQVRDLMVSSQKDGSSSPFHRRNQPFVTTRNMAATWRTNPLIILAILVDHRIWYPPVRAGETAESCDPPLFSPRRVRLF
jgi:hypothetical protein